MHLNNTCALVQTRDVEKHMWRLVTRRVCVVLLAGADWRRCEAEGTVDSLRNRLQTKQNCRLAGGQTSVQACDASGNPPGTLRRDRPVETPSFRCSVKLFIGRRIPGVALLRVPKR